MKKFKKGDLVVDSFGRRGIIIDCYKNLIGNFYYIIYEGDVLNLPEEDLRLVDG